LTVVDDIHRGVGRESHSQATPEPPPRASTLMSGRSPGEDGLRDNGRIRGTRAALLTGGGGGAGGRGGGGAGHRIDARVAPLGAAHLRTPRPTIRWCSCRPKRWCSYSNLHSTRRERSVGLAVATGGDGFVAAVLAGGTTTSQGTGNTWPAVSSIPWRVPCGRTRFVMSASRADHGLRGSLPPIRVSPGHQSGCGVRCTCLPTSANR